MTTCGPRRTSRSRIAGATAVAIAFGRSARNLESDAFAPCDPSTPCADAAVAPIAGIAASDGIAFQF